MKKALLIAILISFPLSAAAAVSPPPQDLSVRTNIFDPIDVRRAS